MESAVDFFGGVKGLGFSLPSEALISPLKRNRASGSFLILFLRIGNSPISFHKPIDMLMNSTRNRLMEFFSAITSGSFFK